jgi:WD40 repeat protein
MNRYHSYGLAELRAGLSPKDLEDSAVALKNGAPMAIDKLGYRYTIRPTGSVNRLVINKEGGKEKTINLPWVPLRVLPSPDGSLIALVSSNGGIVKVYERSTGNSLWSVSFVQGVREFSWSQDSKSLAVASQVGAVVYEGASGEEIRMGCGHWFEKRPTPPPSTASFMQVQNLCER